ncbi:histone deacetylase family protein [Deinococcus cellulosilyticus]|uniref:Histone deacetylase n=1 Tax=Deinococcus cellulosilyticus (strain DSM 18568 / NBRC 106333 / KACC 11606 / 5516J-15) TaxID=1223518 RepID=A0A511N4G2_DEIC1|nr:histone deacetylase [Deinococcus cellulosilyticus]GEM47357.1 histone deacetylase [Deinococcus cellulosilyticus NBRC 106333 = KACC 11606]
MLRAYTPAHIVFPLPEGHRFPLYKYAGVRDRLLGKLPILNAELLPWDLAATVHDHAYLNRWRYGEMSRQEEREYGLPWSVQVVERARAAAGGTLAAMQDALNTGWGINLAGGTHHAFRDRAEGFCLLNDVAICTHLALKEGLAKRILVLDLDVHQGNGTASLLSSFSEVFTLSVHGERNYPFRKEKSSLDIGLPDGVTDVHYLNVLETQVKAALESFRPDLIFYLAGVDVLFNDRFGRFALTLEGVGARDAWVFRWCFGHGIPVVSTMAGGYNRDPEMTVQAAAQTIEVGLFLK